MIRAFVAGLSLLALVACDTSAPLSSDAQVRVVKKAENQFNTAQTVIRAFATGDDGKLVEVTGVRCDLQSGWVRVRGMSVPGAVALPTYLQAERFADRGRPPNMTGTCIYKGRKIPVLIQPSAARSNQSTTQSTGYNATTGTYGTATTTRLTRKLSSTLPWYYPGYRIEVGPLN